jgi:arylsulfatase A-like enzyme
LARGKQKDGNYDAIYGAYVNFQRMIRKDGFKLIVYPKIDKVLLFDLKNDPNEMNDLSGNPDYADLKADLFNQLLALQQEMQDPLVLQNPKIQTTSTK